MAVLEPVAPPASGWDAVIDSSTPVCVEGGTAGPSKIAWLQLVTAETSGPAQGTPWLTILTLSLPWVAVQICPACVPPPIRIPTAAGKGFGPGDGPTASTSAPPDCKTRMPEKVVTACDGGGLSRTTWKPKATAGPLLRAARDPVPATTLALSVTGVPWVLALSAAEAA